MKETLLLTHYGYWDDEKKPDLTVEVEYVPVEHWDGERKAYQIVIDGEVVACRRLTTDV